jgi:hypothetical protein
MFPNPPRHLSKITIIILRNGKKLKYCINTYISIGMPKIALFSHSWTFSMEERGGGAEPVFVDHLRSPGIDSQPGGPVRQPYFSYRPAEPHKLAESISRNRFLGSINDYKYGLRAGERPPLCNFPRTKTIEKERERGGMCSGV